jgi:hypothetical protein
MSALDPIRGERDAIELEQRKAVLEHSARLVEKNFPKAALLDLERCEQTFGPHPDLDAERKDIEKQGVTLRQRFSLFHGDSFANWEKRRGIAGAGRHRRSTSSPRRKRTRCASTVSARLPSWCVSRPEPFPTTASSA